MADMLTFKVLTPTREVFSREVEAANLMAAGGEVGLLPGHAALLSELRPGEASFTADGKTEYFALSEGFLEVAGDQVTALVRSAEAGHEIDADRAEARRAERENELAKDDLAEHEMRVAELSLAKQMARLLVSGRG
jgi:F-type H+-transporting ATPase subunit epsilon